jgi:ABC-type dipeptide/oligopeptide/nickel transport system permease subunit
MASSIHASGTKAVEVGSEAPRRRKVPLFVWASAGFVLVVVLAATFAPLVSPYDPIRQSLRERLKAPTWFPEEGRQRHLLGTDQLGRDILSRVIYGSRISLVVGFAAVLIGGAIGGLLGLISGYTGGILANWRFRSSCWRSGSSPCWDRASGT